MDIGVLYSDSAKICTIRKSDDVRLIDFCDGHNHLYYIYFERCFVLHDSLHKINIL